MENFDTQKTELKRLLIQDVERALTALEQQLPEQANKYNTVLMLWSNLNSINRQRTSGTIAHADYQLELNRIRENTLHFIDQLQAADFAVATQEVEKIDVQKGYLLYKIPTKLQVGVRQKCEVKIALRKALLQEKFAFADNVDIQDIRVSEIMTAELIDISSEQVFDILPVSGQEQFVEDQFVTNWVYYLTPKQVGNHLLILKVAVLEMINGRERKREIVLEEAIQVVTEAVPVQEWSHGMKAAGLAFLLPSQLPTPSTSTPEPAHVGAATSTVAFPTKAILGILVSAAVVFGIYRAVDALQNEPEATTTEISVTPPPDHNAPTTAVATPVVANEAEEAIVATPTAADTILPPTGQSDADKSLRGTASTAAVPTPAVPDGEVWDTLTFHLNLLRKKGERHEINDEKVDQEAYSALQEKKGEAEKVCTPCYVLLRDQDENLIREGHFYQNCPIGNFTDYYLGKKVKVTGKYVRKDGMTDAAITDKNCSVKQGKWIYYYESGQKQKEEFYKKGVRHGPWLYYDEAGNTTGLIEYKDGTIVKQAGKPN